MNCAGHQPHIHTHIRQEKSNFFISNCLYLYSQINGYLFPETMVFNCITDIKAMGHSPVMGSEDDYSMIPSFPGGFRSMLCCFCHLKSAADPS